MKSFTHLQMQLGGLTNRTQKKYKWLPGVQNNMSKNVSRSRPAYRQTGPNFMVLLVSWFLNRKMPSDFYVTN